MEVINERPETQDNRQEIKDTNQKAKAKKDRRQQTRDSRQETIDNDWKIWTIDRHKAQAKKNRESNDSCNFIIERGTGWRLIFAVILRF